MAAKKVNELIKEARTNAGLTQAQLAEEVDGVSASDISKAERGEMDLTNTALRQIAKATGVTQTSLVNAPKATKKTASSSQTAKKKPTSRAAKKPSASSVKKKSDVEKLTATEKKLVELYRAADSDTKKAAMSILKGEKEDFLGALLNGAASLLGKK